MVPLVNAGAAQSSSATERPPTKRVRKNPDQRRAEIVATAREVFAKLAMTEAMLSESKDRPKGPLKVTTTVAFGSTWLTPRIREFLDLYPEIQMAVVVDDSELDLSMREADVATNAAPVPRPEDPVRVVPLAVAGVLAAGAGVPAGAGAAASATATAVAACSCSGWPGSRWRRCCAGWRRRPGR